jgi:Zn-dependent M28 family amino/carboxypeptidase
MKRMALVTVACLAASAATNWNAAGRRWWSHVEYLASDKLEGRGVGSAGFDIAAEYVSQQFERDGLRPGGTEEYFQPVTFTKLALDESESSIQLISTDHKADVKLGDDAVLGVSPDSASTLEAPLVFVGYGLKMPEAGWDDLAGQSLQGAIAVYLQGGPSQVPGNLRAHYSSGPERWKALKAAGAIGTIGLSNPKDMEVPWARISASRLMPRMVLSDPLMAETRGLQFTATWNPKRAGMLFAGSGHTFASLAEAANHGDAVPHFALPLKLKAKTSFSKKTVESKNVVGVRWGSDQQFSNDFVVISAHLDHLGTSDPVNGDSVYNGAMDDASGIASLIEIVRALQKQKVRTKRSILFLAVTGEEKGELGSKYFAAHPTVDGQFVADINMDMFLPLFPLKYLEVQGLTESSLGDDIKAVCEQAGITVQADKEPNKNRFIRSDQYSFVKKGVPALAFKFGYLPGTPQESIFQSWYKERYHGVKDDISQPVDLAAAARFNDILTRLAIRVANAPQNPEWKAASFFRRFAPARNSH